MSNEITYASLLTQFGEPRGHVISSGLPCEADYIVLASLFWRDENLDVLRKVPTDVMLKLSDGGERYVLALQEETLSASTVAEEVSGYSERDVFDEACRVALTLMSCAKQTLQHLVSGVGEHPADALIRARDERIAAESAEAALWSGFEQLREFAQEAARFEDGSQIWHVLNALVEVGVPMQLLGPGVVPTIYCHIVEPNSSLGTDPSENLAAVLDFIGLPYSYNEKHTELILESDGDGWSFKKGREGGWTMELPGLSGWRQVPTSSVDEAHLALLACADRYWSLLPARLKTPRFIREALPQLFHVATVADIPRAAVRAAALSVLADQARSQPSPLPARLH